VPIAIQSQTPAEAKIRSLGRGEAITLVAAMPLDRSLGEVAAIELRQAEAAMSLGAGASRRPLSPAGLLHVRVVGA
jgi:hypothetical protein